MSYTSHSPISRPIYNREKNKLVLPEHVTPNNEYVLRLVHDAFSWINCANDHLVEVTKKIEGRKRLIKDVTGFHLRNYVDLTLNFISPTSEFESDQKRICVELDGTVIPHNQFAWRREIGYLMPLPEPAGLSLESFVRTELGQK